MMMAHTMIYLSESHGGQFGRSGVQLLDNYCNHFAYDMR